MALPVTSLRIAAGGRPVVLDYAGALACHAGDSWFGVAVGFRMLQAASVALSKRRLWDRDELSVVSAHPGGGVRDAVEYVTGCVSRGRYRVDAEQAGTGCSRGMHCRWTIDADSRVVTLAMRDEFVPELLYRLLDRHGTSCEQTGDAARFDALKRRLADEVWQQSLERLFRVDVREPEVTEDA